MREGLVKYLQFTGYVLGVALLLVGGFYAVTHWQELTELAFKTPSGETITKQTLQLEKALKAQQNPRVGRIMKLKDGGAWQGKADKNGQIILNERQVRRKFEHLGFGVLTETTKVLTAAHVLRGSEPKYFYNDTVGLLALNDFEVREASDQATVTVDNSVEMEPLALADDPRLDQKVHMWTNDSYLPQRVDGEIFDLDKVVTLQDAWDSDNVQQIKVVIVQIENNLGDSGGPVFDEKDALVGILVGLDLNDASLSYITRVMPE